MLKNTAGQKWRVFAFNRTTNAPVTGDAANITAKLSIDFGALASVTDTHPTEVEDGYYTFDLTKAETNGHQLDLYPESSTANVVVVGVPASWVTYTDQLTAAGVPGSEASTATESDPIELVRGETWTVDFEDLEALTGASKVYVTMRRVNGTDTDAAATFQANSVGGLTIVNGAAYGTSSDGSVSVVSASAPAVARLTIKPAVTSLIDAPEAYSIDVKAVYSGGTVRVLYRSAVRVVRDITRAIA